MKWALVLLGLIAISVAADAQSIGGMSGLGGGKGLGGGNTGGPACASGNLLLVYSDPCQLLTKMVGL